MISWLVNNGVWLLAGICVVLVSAFLIGFAPRKKSENKITRKPQTVGDTIDAVVAVETAGENRQQTSVPKSGFRQMLEQKQKRKLRQKQNLQQRVEQKRRQKPRYGKAAAETG
mgnify:CR=1 FL=1